MKLIDLQKQTANVTSTDSITLGAALDNCRTVAQAIAAGDATDNTSGWSFVVRNKATGAFETREFTISNNGATLTGGTRRSSSNNGQAVAFGGAACEVYSAAPAATVNALLSSADGIAPTDLPAATSFADADNVVIVQGGTLKLLPAAIAKAYYGTVGAGADTTAPTVTTVIASASGATTATGSASTNEANGTMYWLYDTNATATAAAVKAGSSKTITATGAQSLAGTGLTAGTSYYLHVLHRDAAGNDSAVVNSTQFSTQAASGGGGAGTTQYPRIQNPAAANATETGTAPGPYSYSTNYGNNGKIIGLFDLGFANGQDGSFTLSPASNTNFCIGMVASGLVQTEAEMSFSIGLQFQGSTTYTVSGQGTTVNSGFTATDETDTVRFTRTGTTLVVDGHAAGSSAWTTFRTFTNVPTSAFKFEIISTYGGANNVSGTGLA